MASPVEGANEASGIERRRQPRTSIQLRATVLLPDDQLLMAHTIDLSNGGACLSVPAQLIADDEVRLALQFEAVGIKHNLLLIARVCYCSAQGPAFRAGVQFVQVAQEDAALLGTLLG